MPTNEEISTQRSISVLMNILETDGTFKDMTDAEIQSIIDYEKHIAYMNGTNAQLQNEHATYCTSMQEITASSLQAQEAMLQSIVERASNPQLQVIQYG